MLSGANPGYAQSSTTAWTSSGWVTNGTLYDLTGNSALTSNSPLIAGHSYNLTITVVVPNTSTSTKYFFVSLNPKFTASSEPVFWTVQNPSYPGYISSNFTGGDKTVTLNYDQGTVRLSAYFQVPGNFTIPVAKYSTPSGNGTITLHLPTNGIILAAVVPEGSTGTGAFSASIEDQDIQTYQNSYSSASNLIPTGKVPSAYSSLVNSILAEAQALNRLGLPSNGTALLGSLVPSAFPTPPSNGQQTDLLAGLGGAIVVIILLAVVTVRGRGRSGYSNVIIGDVQKELAVLEVTAAKYDRSMADKLKALRDKLSESN